MKKGTRTAGPRGRAGARGRTGAPGRTGPRGPAGERGATGGLSSNHIGRISELREHVREQLRDALKDAEPVKELQQQVEGALKHIDEIGELRQQTEQIQKEQFIQLQRIARIQAQLDQLMGILFLSPEENLTIAG